MKKQLWWLIVGWMLLLTGCAAPPVAETLTDEQRLSDAMLLCREDLSKGQAALRELDAQIVGGKQTAGESSTLAVWQLHRGEQYLLLWQLTCTAAEEHPGHLDTLRLTWEGSKYYRSEGDETWSTVQGRTENTVSFNIEDDHLAAGDTTCGAVYLQAPATAYGAELEHTAAAQETTLTADGDTVTATTRDAQQTWTLSLEHKEDTP